jgi:hypothetical protein
MVRSAFGEWHVPKDFRVVWSLRPPGDLDAALNKRHGAGSASPINARPALRAAEPGAAAFVANGEAKPHFVDSSPPEPPPPLLRQPRNNSTAPDVGLTRPPIVQSPFNFDDLEEVGFSHAPETRSRAG